MKTVERLYMCIDCDWQGLLEECYFDSEYDPFREVDHQYPICPKCEGAVEY